MAVAPNAWTWISLLLGAAGGLALLWMNLHKPNRRESPTDSRWAGWRDRRRLGRSARPGREHPDGIVLGWLGRRVLQTPREDNAIVFGVQRSGKTSTVVVPTLLAWRGAVVATSTKDELVRLTARHRAALGPVWVFAPLDDPTGVLPAGAQAVRWNPVASADSAAAAAELADMFTAEGKRSGSAHWYLSAASLLTGLILAEHAEGGDFRSVLSLLNKSPHGEYAGLAKKYGEIAAGEILSGFAATPEREAGSTASTARACLNLWLDERVAAATSSGGGQLDVERLLTEGGTLYLVAPAEEAERCRPLFSALLQTILRHATQRARAQGGVLEPRLLLALDEVANFARIPRLAGYVSTGPGQGLQALLCFHDLAQVEAAYGEEQARTIWNNCRARLLLPGQADLKTLDLFSRSIGDETRLLETTTRGAGGNSRHESRSSHRLAPSAWLRQREQPVLVYDTAPAARLVTRRWDQVPRWRALVSASPHPVAPARQAQLMKRWS